MRIALHVTRLLLSVLLVLTSAPLYAEQAAPGLDPRIQKVLSDIDALGADKFNPCKTPTSRNKSNCTPGEYVLWTSFADNEKLKQLEQLGPESVTVGDTPGGVVAATELEKTGLDWGRQVVVWEQLSKAYVEYLLTKQTRVTVHVGGNVRQPNPQSVFCRIELPTILKNKPDQVVLISSRDSKYAAYNGRRITAQDQWPCGEAPPVVLADADAPGDGMTPAAGAGHFEKGVNPTRLNDPAKAWSQLLGKIKSNPIIARLASLTVKHVSDNQFTFHSSVNVAGKALGYSGKLTMNPQAQNNELLLKIEASLTTGKFTLGALEATGALLDLVVVNESGSEKIYARIRPQIRNKGKAIPAVVQFGTAEDGQGVSYDVDLGKNVSLIDLIPSVANLSSLKSSLIGDMKILKDSYHVGGVIAGKHFTVTVGVKKPGEFEIVSDDLKISDLIEQAKTVRFFENYAFERLSHAGKSVTIAGTINKKQATVTYAYAEGRSLTVQGEGLKLSDVVPEANGLKAFDKVALSLVSVNAKQFEVDGELAGKKIRFVKSLVSTSAVSVTADDLHAGDVLPALKNVPGLDAVAVEKIDLNPEYIEVEVLLNGDRVDLVSHTGENSKSDYIAIYLEKLSAATFIPAASGHWINELELDQALFIIQSGRSASRTIAASDLPGELGKLAGLHGNDKLDIRPGLNISSRLNVAGSRRLADMFNAMGLKAGSLPLRGTLSAATFKSLAGKGRGQNSSVTGADKSALLDGLALTVDLPVPSIPSVGQFVKVAGPAKMSIGGAAQGNDIRSRLPKSMAGSRPADGLDLSIQFGVELTGASLNERLDALVDIGTGDHKGLSLLVLSKGQWESPFGVTAITLKSGGFRFALASEKNARQGELAFFGVADLGKHKDVEVSADLSADKGRLKLNYFALDGKFSLEDIPGGNTIPHAGNFELDEIKLSGRGVEARTVLAGKQVNAFLFELAGNNWVFAIDQKNFKFAELLPVIKEIKPLDSITLSRAALIISQKGLTGSHKDMPEIAQDMLRDVFGKSNVDIKIPGGIGLLAAFDEHQMGLVGKGLKKIGVHDDAILMGELTGIFQGKPGILISLMMEQAGTPSGIPHKVISLPAGAAPQFFMQWSGAEFYVGAGVGLNVKAGKDRLHLDSKIELDFSEKGIGVDILGEMDGTWHKPFGINGISLSDLKMKVGINDIGEVLIGFSGHDRIGKEDINLAAEMKILLEDALPDGVAFSATMNSLGAPAIIDIAETLMGAKGKLNNRPVPFFEIHDAKLAFATPGATDPQLGLVSAGFAFKGQFFFMNRKLGEVDGLGSVTNGITFSGDISDIDLEALKFQENKIDMAINLHPKFVLHSSIQVLGAKQVVSLDLTPPHLEFDLTEKLDSFGEADLRVRIDGFDLAKGTYFSNSDISVVGLFKSNLVPWMEEEIRTGITELRTSADARLNANLAALKAAQDKVDRINDKIRKLRASDDREKSRAADNINNAEKRVASLKSDYERAMRESRQCGNNWTHWACSEYWKTQAASIRVVYQAAIGILETIKSTEAAAFDYDPRLAALIAERDIEHAALSVAQGVVDAAKAANDFVLNKLEHVLEAELKHLPFELNQAVLVGDLRDMIKHDAPLVLDMKFRMFGTPMREYFAIKIRDPAFDAVSFALLPAIAMDRLTEKALQKADPAVARWLHSHIAAKLAQAEAAVRRQVQAEEKKYANILKTFESGSAKFRKSYGEQAGQHIAIVAATQVSDLFGDSKTFKDTYLAVGHSSLCLGVAINGTDVIQENCKNVEADRWSTKSVADGYVQLMNKGLCLKARNKSTTESNPLMLAGCNKGDVHEQWKVVSMDGFYDKIVNRYSQKCLHFDRENANPKTARAVWSSCVGADSQTFRDIRDAEKPAWHEIRSRLQAKNGSCLSIKGGNQSGTQAGMLKLQISAGRLTRNQYRQLQRAGDDVLLAEHCDREEDTFNYVELVNGDIKLVHAKTGWCVHPRAGRDPGLVLAPCDRGADMTWRLMQAKGAAWTMMNVSKKRCLTLPAMQNSRPNQRQASLAACQQNSAQQFDFVR